MASPKCATSEPTRPFIRPPNAPLLPFLKFITQHMNIQTPNNANLEFFSHSSVATTEVAGEEEMEVQSPAPWKVADSGFWGMLVPLFHGVGLTQLNFQRTFPVVMLGSAPGNHIVINHEKISASSLQYYLSNHNAPQVHSIAHFIGTRRTITLLFSCATTQKVGHS